MKILYFDCFAGISGDMSLGALTALGVESAYLVSELGKLNITGWRLEISQVMKNGICANLASVILEREEHCHRAFKDICVIIDGSALSERVKKLSKNIFRRVAVAEAKVHGVPLEDVHFHEVGAVDSIIDIVGVAICVERLNPDRVMASVVNDGHGFVTCQHGKIPVPVPAVMEIFSDKKVKSRQIDVNQELVTPTGAAIITELAESFGLMPEMIVKKTGYGAGSRQLDIPNVLRATLGETYETSQTITVLETNIDDCTPEILGYVMEKLLNEGAKDVYFTNIQMKKNRPAIMLTVLCAEEAAADMERVIFRETSTIGIRSRRELRRCLPRETKRVSSAFGEVTVKEAVFEGVEKVSPEYESARLLAEANNVPLRSVYDAARAAAGRADI